MFFHLFRIQQWYKNLVIFLPLIFAGLLIDRNAITLVLLGFFALCLMSSANYILNDFVDKEKDKIHPEKKLRPIASGVVSKPFALFLAGLLASASLMIGILFSTEFFFLLLCLFLFTQAYTLFFKKEAFADILLISVNFVIRAMSGAFILDVRLSPWLLVCTFFLSFFLVIGKRKADLFYLGNNATNHRESFKEFSEEILNILLSIATTSLLVSYTLYSFLSIYPSLVYTLPFSLYVILRYLFLIKSRSIIARKPELFYKDLRLVVGIVFWITGVLCVMYLL